MESKKKSKLIDLEILQMYYFILLFVLLAGQFENGKCYKIQIGLPVAIRNILQKMKIAIGNRGEIVET